MNRRGRRILFTSILGAAAIAIVLLADYTYLFSNNSSPQVIREKQLVVRPVILSWVDQSGEHLYQWTTSVRMLAKGGIVAMNATVNIPGMNPVSTTDFMIGLTTLARNNPLYYNATAVSAGLDLPVPSPDFIHAGQSFPETLAVKYDNGTVSTLAFDVRVVSVQ